MRHVDQPRNANARSDPGNALSALDMDVIESKVSTRRGGLGVSICRNEVLKKNALGLIITTDEVVHDIGVPNAFSDLFFVANVPFLPGST
jgi:hypothetical protein